MRYQSDRPIHLGITGVACSGKTTLADTLAPRVRIVVDDDELSGIWWEHITMGKPFHELVSILQMTEGEAARERIRYAFHEVLADVINPSNADVHYVDLVDLVLELSAWNVDGDSKPRAFMQTVSSKVRALDPNCLTTSTIRRMRIAEAQFNKEQAEREDREEELDKVPPVLGIVVSDVRIADQCGMVRDQPNNMMIKLTAPESVLRERQINLGHGAGLETHDTESWPATAPDETFDAIYDTSEMTPHEICVDIHQHIHKLIGE